MSSEKPSGSRLTRLFRRDRATPEDAGALASPLTSTVPVPAEFGALPSNAQRWQKGLDKTSAHIGSALGRLFSGRRLLDEDLLEEMETLLLTADVGVETTLHLLEQFRQRAKKGIAASGDFLDFFHRLLVELLTMKPSAISLQESSPSVVMMVGVNGAGKTTSVGKLAASLKQRGKSVVLAAGDTFRAAAVEQLQVWGERNDVPVIAQDAGADSASVIYDALHSAQARSVDVLIADTAGRLHNKASLMEELGKIVRVVKKLDQNAPHELLLVVDAATGQNALNQAREFCRAVPVTGLVLTKLDGSAKGGVVLALVNQLKLPVKFVGLGEGIEDFAEFDADLFVRALLGKSNPDSSVVEAQREMQPSPAGGARDSV